MICRCYGCSPSTINSRAHVDELTQQGPSSKTCETDITGSANDVTNPVRDYNVWGLLLCKPCIDEVLGWSGDRVHEYGCAGITRV
jgi:hypothetical protein